MRDMLEDVTIDYAREPVKQQMLALQKRRVPSWLIKGDKCLSNSLSFMLN